MSNAIIKLKIGSQFFYCIKQKSFIPFHLPPALTKSNVQNHYIWNIFCIIFYSHLSFLQIIYLVFRESLSTFWFVSVSTGWTSFVLLNKTDTYCTKNEVFHKAFLQLMWPNPPETVDLAIFTEEILIGKLRFLCSDC